MFLKLRKNSMCSVERGTGNGKMKTGKKNRKWITEPRFKFSFVHIFHFPVPVLVSRSPL